MAEHKKTGGPVAGITAAVMSAILAFALAASAPLYARENPAAPRPPRKGSDAFRDFAPMASGEFAFYRDYTFTEPTWTGILSYDENTWAAQTFAPGTGRRVTVFFTGEIQNGEFILTGQRNDSDFRQEDVPFINYLMQILPFLYNTRLTAEAAGGNAPEQNARTADDARTSGFLPPRIQAAADSPLFGGKCEATFAPETPLFNVIHIKDASGKKVFEFEYGGIISKETSAGFFNFEPIPPEAKKQLAEITAKRTPETDVTDVRAEQISPNFFLVGETVFILTGSQKRGDDPPERFFARMAKETLLSPNALLIAMPGSFSAEETALKSEAGSENAAKRKREIVLTQVFYEKESGEIIRDIRIIRADSASDEYAFAIVSGFEASVAERTESLKRLARKILDGLDDAAR